MKFLGFIIALLLSSSFVLADPPATLTLADLANRPDRWPPAVSVNQDLQFTNGTVVHSTDKLKVIDFNGSQLVLITSGNMKFIVKPEDCNFLDAANQAWSALTPAQRAVDPTSLAADMSLWPAQVTMVQSIVYPQWGTLNPGTVVTLYSVNSQNMTIDWPNSPNRMNINVSATDLMSRAQQLAGLDPDKRPSRIGAVLAPMLVDSDGKPYQGDLQSKKYFAFYSGAGWCPPCQAFSPDLVKFANATLPNHPELQFVMLSNDKTTADMLTYMKQEQMPFPAVPMNVLNTSALLISYSNQIIPDLVVTDRNGKVVVSSIDSQGNRGDPEDTLKQLGTILNQPAAQ
jgi:nucleoredoxin